MYNVFEIILYKLLYCQVFFSNFLFLDRKNSFTYFIEKGNEIIVPLFGVVATPLLE